MLTYLLDVSEIMIVITFIFCLAKSDDKDDSSIETVHTPLQDPGEHNVRILLNCYINK